jgi:catechol 2,3-dioxygenase-like lactoylglutathione lyase family enzyme
MSLDLFAGIAVSDYAAALQWYERLFGSPPAFIPDPTEAVWQLDEHRFVYIDDRPENAGHAILTVFLSDLDAFSAEAAARGLEPVDRETYANGVRKLIYRDPDGNEIGFGGGPATD